MNEKTKLSTNTIYALSPSSFVIMDDDQTGAWIVSYQGEGNLPIISDFYPLNSGERGTDFVRRVAFAEGMGSFYGEGNARKIFSYESWQKITNTSGQTLAASLIQEAWSVLGDGVFSPELIKLCLSKATDFESVAQNSYQETEIGDQAAIEEFLAIALEEALIHFCFPIAEKMQEDLWELAQELEAIEYELELLRQADDDFDDDNDDEDDDDDFDDFVCVPITPFLCLYLDSAMMVQGYQAFHWGVWEKGRTRYENAQKEIEHMLGKEIAPNADARFIVSHGDVQYWASSWSENEDAARDEAMRCMYGVIEAAGGDDADWAAFTLANLEALFSNASVNLSDNPLDSLVVLLAEKAIELVQAERLVSFPLTIILGFGHALTQENRQSPLYEWKYSDNGAWDVRELDKDVWQSFAEKIHFPERPIGADESELEQLATEYGGFSKDEITWLSIIGGGALMLGELGYKKESLPYNQDPAIFGEAAQLAAKDALLSAWKLEN